MIEINLQGFKSVDKGKCFKSVIKHQSSSYLPNHDALFKGGK